MRPIRIPLLLIALLSSVATSYSDPYIEQIWALSIVHNGGPEAVELSVQVPAAELGCELLRDHPELYGHIPWLEPVALSLSPGANYGPTALNPGDTVGCTAARVIVGQEAPVVMFNDLLDFPMRGFPLAYESLSEVGPAVLVVVEDSSQVWRPTSPDFVFDEPAPLGSCEDREPLSLSTRAGGEVTVLSARVDKGCTRLDLLTVGGAVEELELCIDPALIPWEAGDSVSISGGPSSLVIEGKAAELRVLLEPEELPFGLHPIPDRLTRFECVDSEEGWLGRRLAEASEVHLLGEEVDHGVAIVGEILSTQLNEQTDAYIWFNRYALPLMDLDEGVVELAILSWER